MEDFDLYFPFFILAHEVVETPAPSRLPFPCPDALPVQLQQNE
jgi:hypothetical protein